MKIIHKKKASKNLKNKFQSQLSFGEILKRFFVFWFLMFFCALVINQQESFLLKISNNPQEVIFVFPGSPNDWGIDENEILTHGAADDWGYLFEDEVTDEQIFKPIETTDNQDNNSVSVEKDFISHDKDYFPNDKDIFSDNKDNFSDDKDIFYEGVDISDIVIEDEIPDDQDQLKVCITPWGEYVANGDFVLAYEQRKDVDNLCNVQRRFCYDGILDGTYIQKSCKENTLYSYVKPDAISYTQKPVDTFVQPNQPSLSGANFDTHGKIDGTTNSIDVWGLPGSGRPVDIVSTSQTSLSNTVCITPWGEKIKNGQFVKAYKSSIGLIDLPCEVELRMCVGGNLKGYYENRTCTFKKMTYRDYLSENYDLDSPTIGDLINTIDTDEKQTTYKNRLFWKWLDKYF
ncbi:MAG: hypothetical protein PHR61_02650 [Candidatus Absconditabacteria bacterium]|nr:hypothetical protein [Candidatus Absconditabacteria bacterium]